MSRGNVVEVQFWGSDLCLVSMYRDGNITNGSGVEWWDLAHPGSMHIVTREQVLLRWSIVTAEMSQVKDRQKSVIEKRGGAVMRRLLRRCCKAVASRVEICEKIILGQCWREGWRATSSSGEYEPRCSTLWISAQDIHDPYFLFHTCVCKSNVYLHMDCSVCGQPHLALAGVGV